jgi:hypothetical protein
MAAAVGEQGREEEEAEEERPRLRRLRLLGGRRTRARRVGMN